MQYKAPNSKTVLTTGRTKESKSQLEHGMSGHELWSLGVAVMAMSGRTLERYKQGSMTQVGKWSMKRWRIAEVEINCCS